MNGTTKTQHLHDKNAKIKAHRKHTKAQVGNVSLALERNNKHGWNNHATSLRRRPEIAEAFFHATLTYRQHWQGGTKTIGRAYVVIKLGNRYRETFANLNGTVVVPRVMALTAVHFTIHVGDIKGGEIFTATCDNKPFRGDTKGVKLGFRGTSVCEQCKSINGFIFKFTIRLNPGPRRGPVKWSSFKIGFTASVRVNVFISAGQRRVNNVPFLAQDARRDTQSQDCL